MMMLNDIQYKTSLKEQIFGLIWWKCTWALLMGLEKEG